MEEPQILIAASPGKGKNDRNESNNSSERAARKKGTNRKPYGSQKVKDVKARNRKRKLADSG